MMSDTRPTDSNQDFLGSLIQYLTTELKMKGKKLEEDEISEGVSFRIVTDIHKELGIKNENQDFTNDEVVPNTLEDSIRKDHLNNCHVGYVHSQCDLCKISYREVNSTISKEPCSTEMPSERFTEREYYKSRLDSRIRSASTKIRLHSRKSAITCDICNKRFSVLSSLKAHKLIHMGVKPFSCKICNKLFSQLSSLKTHNRLHTGEKPYACEWCPKTFSDRSNFRKHIQVHTGKKSFISNTRHKTFSQLPTLKTYRLQTDEKPFLCEICNKAFSKMATLKTHIRIHTGERPYVCEWCQKTFSDKSNFKKHILIHTVPKTSFE